MDCSHINIWKARLFKRFLSESDFRPGTRLTFGAALRCFADWCLAQDVSVPDAAAINRWKAYLLDGYEVATARTYLSVVKVFSRWMAHRGLGGDIAASVKGVKPEKGFRKDCLSDVQMKSVLMLLERQAKGSRGQGHLRERALRDFVMVLLIASCGLRVSEVSQLDVGDLDTVYGRPVVWVHGKGRDGKSDFVRITSELERVLFRYFEKRHALSGQSPMFVSYSRNSHGKRLTSRSISRIVKGAMVAAGLDSPRLTAHSLRHTAVTLALKHGATLQQVQQFARHRMMETTLRYAHNLELVSNPCSQLVMKSIGRIDGPQIQRLKQRPASSPAAVSGPAVPLGMDDPSSS